MSSVVSSVVETVLVNVPVPSRNHIPEILLWGARIETGDESSISRIAESAFNEILSVEWTSSSSSSSKKAKITSESFEPESPEDVVLAFPKPQLKGMSSTIILHSSNSNFRLDFPLSNVLKIINPSRVDSWVLSWISVAVTESNFSSYVSIVVDVPIFFPK